MNPLITTIAEDEYIVVPGEELVHDDMVIPKNPDDGFYGHIHSVCFGEAIVVCGHCGISHMERYQLNDLYKVVKINTEGASLGAIFNERFTN